MIKIILALTTISHQTAIPVIDIHDWVLPSYGSAMVFEIKRNGKKIGIHQVNFKTNNEQLSIESKTKIRVKFLFFNAYKFDYNSLEKWKNGELVSLLSTTNDNGKKSTVNLASGTDIINVTINDDTHVNSLDDLKYTTNHWNPNVLAAKQVLNTITGKSNQFQITQAESNLVSTGSGERIATHYQYSGDLNNISTWYDEKMRWVGLSFESNDGSTISYECKQCGVE